MPASLPSTGKVKIFFSSLCFSFRNRLVAIFAAIAHEANDPADALSDL
jgi:hypothetical protein